VRKSLWVFVVKSDIDLETNELKSLHPAVFQLAVTLLSVGTPAT